MKYIKLFLIALFLIALGCESYPQEVEARTSYTLPSGIDSAKIMLWVGDNPSECPLFENGSWEALDKESLIIDDILPTSTSFSHIINNPGKSIKLALVVFDYGFSSDLATSSFYTLPRKPGKATILNVQIIIP